MLLNIYLDDEQSEVLMAFAEHDDMTAEDKASELLNDLLAQIWADLQEEFLS